jgi:hypothetical protein
MKNQDKFKPFEKQERKYYSKEYNKQRTAHRKAAKKVENKLTIKVREQHALFTEKVKKQLAIAEEELKVVHRSRNYLYAKLLKHKEIINTKANLSFNEIVSALNNVKVDKLEVASEDFDLGKFLVNWKTYIVINRKFRKTTDTIKSLKRRILKFEDWLQIVKKFNKAIVKEIVEQGYEFHMGHGLTSIRILRRIRENPQIDNPASYQKRKEIVAAGLTPYHKINAPDGVKWRVYRTERYKFVWYWSKKAVSVKNAYYYKYTPTGGKKGQILYLYNFINENPGHTIKYKY